MPTKSKTEARRRPRATTRRKSTTKVSRTKRCMKNKFGTVMGEYKRGKLRYAQSRARPSGMRVNNRRQALAIAYSVSRASCKPKRKKTVTRKRRK